MYDCHKHGPQGGDRCEPCTVHAFVQPPGVATQTDPQAKTGPDRLSLHKKNIGTQSKVGDRMEIRAERYEVVDIVNEDQVILGRLP